MNRQHSEEEVKALLAKANAVEASINASEEARAELKRAIGARDHHAACALLKSHGLEVRAENLHLATEEPNHGGPEPEPPHGGPTPRLVCLQYRYYLTPYWSGWGIDWKVHEFCGLWAHG